MGIISIPLAMALAIASGVPPQYGLYTAIFGGFVVALTGGSRFSVTGPTAAFVVILYPVAQQYGLGGLAVATMMSGCILIGLAISRLGRLIEYISEPVTLGFTSGIAIVIATLQLKDLFGLQIAEMPEKYVGKVAAIMDAFPGFQWPSMLAGCVTLLILIFWPKLKLPVPGHLPALLFGVAVSLILNNFGYSVDTIGTRFEYALGDGGIGHGIPPFFPHFEFPWNLPGADGSPMVWSVKTFEALLPVAFSIAMLGAIESLLCAVVMDGMSGKRHHSNGELLGQGIGNVLVPFFGGVTATAAIARSAANYRAGAQSPVAAMIHSVVVLAGLLFCAPILAHLPMPCMAGMLLFVAWNISEAHKVLNLIRKAPYGDILVLLTCLSLTVFVDMVYAITAGVMLASILFMRDISELTKVIDIGSENKLLPDSLKDTWVVYKINGPLFFAAAERIFIELGYHLEAKKGVVLYMESVTVIDAGGLTALNRFHDFCRENGIRVIFASIQFQPMKTMQHAGIKSIPGEFEFAGTLNEAIHLAKGEDFLQVA